MPPDATGAGAARRAAAEQSPSLLALAEAVFHFERFMAATGTAVGWLRFSSRYGNGSRANRGVSAESDRDYR